MRILSHQRGNPDTDVSRSLPHRATSRLYPRFMNAVISRNVCLGARVRGCAGLVGVTVAIRGAKLAIFC